MRKGPQPRPFLYCYHMLRSPNSDILGENSSFVYKEKQLMPVTKQNVKPLKYWNLFQQLAILLYRLPRFLHSIPCSHSLTLHLLFHLFVHATLSYMSESVLGAEETNIKKNKTFPWPLSSGG